MTRLIDRKWIENALKQNENEGKMYPKIPKKRQIWSHFCLKWCQKCTKRYFFVDYALNFSILCDGMIFDMI